MLAAGKNATNPLAALPSVLAIRDIRRRVRTALGPSHPRLAVQRRLLSIDPLTVLRCMRAALAPVYGVHKRHWSIPEIIDSVGPSLVGRALETAPIDVAGTGPIRKLWLHAVATAHAARALAAGSDIMDPERAYLLGLLHDLPLWLHFLGRRQKGAPTPGSTSEWIRHWNLPDELAQVIDRVNLDKELSATRTPTEPAALVCAAELMAELADFWHPDAGDPMARELLLSTVNRDELIAAQRLRLEVQADLRYVGLDVALPEPQPELERYEPEEDLALFPAKQSGGISEVVLSILSCSKSASYRGIITATTSAALRYMGYDRAWYVKWVRELGRVAVRAKADLSPRRLTTELIAPTQLESDALARCLTKEQPQLVRAPRHCRNGMLHWLGMDEALVVPLNSEFATPSFLIVDRALSARPVRVRQDSEIASTLAGTASLLTENLLLKRRRQRAQKFALTDPLTRLANRGMGITSLDQEVARAHRSGTPLTLLMLDLDDFKKLNDQFGHVQGDHALRSVSEVLRKTLRKTDTICRYGGEEFMVVLPETTAEDASILAARVFTAVEADGERLGLPMTVSIGLATMRPDDKTESFLHRADQALYASKAAGRNRFSVDVDTD